MDYGLDGDLSPEDTKGNRDIFGIVVGSRRWIFCGI